jgi:predicted glycoside hydrolase/deacetylase ChbG (UPF0249 family)
MIKYIFAALILAQALPGISQPGKNLAELLGYPRDSKLLIIHADDFGLSNSVNRATLKAFDAGGITSASIMMPCPWARDICTFFKDNNRYDVGIHLTMTAEWETYKWDGILPAGTISSLLTKEGYFPSDVEELGKQAKGVEAEAELRAQIDLAISLGVKPTHIDTHMGSVLANPELVNAYFSLSELYRLPILFPRSYLSVLPRDVAEKVGKQVFLLDNLFMLDPAMTSSGWEGAYRKGVESLKPGLNQIIVHVGYDNEEMQAISRKHDDYGSAWRQKDLDFVTGKEFKKMLSDNNIILISWGQVRDLMVKGFSK